ncbi:MAG: RES family NAD+ phosphorylase [Phreatobacter sp.]|nr:RES family NAD+ phosphorylase [Phreatobacter sp.]
MTPASRAHDRALLDALDAFDPEPFAGDVWRITRKGRDPLRGAAANGRWSLSGGFEVLYTSLERDGALAEIGYRLGLEPVWPSRTEHEIHRIAAATARNLRFVDVASLSPLGVDPARYQSLDYAATQAVAAAAHFLEFDGLVVPNARHACLNLVIFLDRVERGALDLRESQAVDWAAWRLTQRPPR